MNKNIKKIQLLNNKIENTGGPGIQMSEVENVHVAENKISHSGSNNDSRKWGRGSGLWTWGSSNVLTEKNKKEIKKAVEKVVKEYGQTLKLLGRE